MSINEVLDKLTQPEIPAREKEIMLNNIKKGKPLDADDIEQITAHVHEYLIENNLHFNYFVLDLNNVEIIAFANERTELRIISPHEMVVAVPSDYTHLKNYHTEQL
ncbi:MAG: hypothetical protein PHW96_00920 [Candidatus Nanoarchaeia archaeon]|nr:hypothetical protein [Candidatus Nanoarchaeia archaeon]